MFSDQTVRLDVVLAIAGMNGLGSRLENIELSGAPVLGPLDIHRHWWPASADNALRRDMPSWRAPVPHSRPDETVALRLDNLSRSGASLVLPIDHLHFFATQSPADNGSRAGFQSWLKDDPFVRRCHSLDDGFSQSPCGVDHDDVTKT